MWFISYFSSQFSQTCYSIQTISFFLYYKVPFTLPFYALHLFMLHIHITAIKLLRSACKFSFVTSVTINITFEVLLAVDDIGRPRFLISLRHSFFKIEEKVLKPNKF
jgi:hypothetical protein